SLIAPGPGGGVEGGAVVAAPRVRKRFNAHNGCGDDCPSLDAACTTTCRSASSSRDGVASPRLRRGSLSTGAATPSAVTGGSGDGVPLLLPNSANVSRCRA